MHELPPDPELEAFYAADRAIPAFDSNAAARILARVEGAAAASAAAGLGSAAAKSITAKAATAIAVACFLGGMVAGGAIVASVRPDPVPVASISASTRSEHAELRPTITEADPTPAPIEPPPPAVAPAPRVEPSEPPPRVEPSTPRASDLPAERRLLEAARAALARDRADNAEESLARHRRRFEEGELAEERDSLFVEVLFAEERWDEVGRAADAFVARYPSSLYRGRVARFARTARERAHARPSESDRPSEPLTSDGRDAPRGAE
ncbi:MAG: hypothetical protein AB7S26_09855 [Sandaracinaceae bacterium]